MNTLIKMSENKNVEETKKPRVVKSTAELQKIRLEKLMKNPEKPVFIPEKREDKLPRVFKPPEFIRNIWGSSAGAGSGDFHVYRGVRRREYARQKHEKETAAKDEKDEEFQKKVEENRIAAESKTAKKRAKRLKKKLRQKNNKKQKTSQEGANPTPESDSEEEDKDGENTADAEEQ